MMCCFALRCVAVRCDALHCVVLRCIMLYYVVLCCIMLYYVALFIPNVTGPKDPVRGRKPEQYYKY